MEWTTLERERPTFILLTEDIKYLDEAQRQCAGEVSDCAAQECHFASCPQHVCVCVWAARGGMRRRQRLG